MFDRAIDREAEFELCLKPFRRKFITGAAKIAQHAQKIFPDEMRHHEAIVQRRAPAHQIALLRFAPEPGHQRTQQQLLRQRHACIRRHFERAEFHQPQAPCRTVGRIALVDADFGAMRIAAHVDEQIAIEPVHQPDRKGALARHRRIGECDLQFIKRVMTRLIDAWRLARRADEHAGEQVGQSRMALPIEHEAAQHVGPAQER